MLESELESITMLQWQFIVQGQAGPSVVVQEFSYGEWLSKCHVVTTRFYQTADGLAVRKLITGNYEIPALDDQEYVAVTPDESERDKRMRESPSPWPASIPARMNPGVREQIRSWLKGFWIAWISVMRCL